MKQTYVHYEKVTRDILDTVKVGDLIKVNDWKRPMRVMAVSENYFVMVSQVCGNPMYSVCSKLPWNGIRHNAMLGGMFHCGRDHWVFGSPLCSKYPNLYSFTNEEANREYLQEFENGEAEISERNGIPIFDLYVKG